MNSNEAKHVSLGQTKQFWVCLFGPLITGFIIGCIIYSQSDYSHFCLAYECWENFTRIYKVPLAVASLSLPLVAMIATLYRSHETSIQIRQSVDAYSESVKNNVYGNFLKHRDGFFEIGPNVLEVLAFKAIKSRPTFDAAALYAILYPDNNFTSLVFYIIPGSFKVQAMERCIVDIFHQCQLTIPDVHVIADRTLKFSKALQLRIDEPLSISFKQELAEDNVFMSSDVLPAINVNGVIIESIAMQVHICVLYYRYVLGYGCYKPVEVSRDLNYGLVFDALTRGACSELRTIGMPQKMLDAAESDKG